MPDIIHRGLTRQCTQFRLRVVAAVERALHADPISFDNFLKVVKALQLPCPNQWNLQVVRAKFYLVKTTSVHVPGTPEHHIV